MKRKRTIVALGLALGLVAGSGALVWASSDPSVPLACANIVSGVGNWQAPVQQKDTLGNPTWVTAGSISFQMFLEEASCLDVTYGLVILEQNPVTGEVPPKVLASSSVPGDGISTQIHFELPVTADTSQAKVCAYVYTFGGTGTSSTGKTGAAFDGTSGGELLDRGPDWPPAAGQTGTYCALVPGGGGSGYN
jgi:hypothetical protein